MGITRANVTTRIVRGMLGGALGASAMTIVRLTARRLGLVEAMVPQSAEARVTEASGVEPPGKPTSRRIGLVGQAALSALALSGSMAAAARPQAIRRALLVACMEKSVKKSSKNQRGPA